MVEVGQTERANQAFQLALQVAQKIEERIGIVLQGCLQASPTTIGVFWCSRRRGKRKGLIKPSNSPFKSPRKLKTHRFVLWRLLILLKRWRKAEQFDRALQIAQKIEDASDRSLALWGIANSDWQKVGQFNRAVKVAEMIE
jgi:hypothetical protein